MRIKIITGFAIILFCCSAKSVQSQSLQLMTNAEIYDFNIGDVFETKVGGYSTPPTYSIDTIINKYYSVGMDTVFYVKNSRSYTSPACPPPYTGSSSYTVGSIIYYTNLNDTVGKGLGAKPFDLNCIDTNGYTGIWVDTTYYNPNFCNIKTTTIKYINNVFSLIDTCYSYFEPYNGEDIYGKGLGWINHYYNTCSNGFPYCEEVSQLIYYKKDTISCGSYSGVYITGINQITTNKDQISIYPNPSLGVFNIINKQVTSSSLKISIFNTIGKRIMEIEKLPHEEISFDFSNQQNGLYFIVIYNGIETITQKIIINH